MHISRTQKQRPLVWSTASTSPISQNELSHVMAFLVSIHHENSCNPQINPITNNITNLTIFSDITTHNADYR